MRGESIYAFVVYLLFVMYKQTLSKNGSFIVTVITNYWYNANAWKKFVF